MHVVLFKPGAEPKFIAPAGACILNALSKAAVAYGTDLEITCSTGGHAPDDPHTSGEAYDVSVNGVPSTDVIRRMGFLRGNLGELFTVLYETPHAPPCAELRSIAFVNPDATAPHLHVQRKKGTVYPPSPAAADSTTRTA